MTQEQGWCPAAISCSIHQSCAQCFIVPIIVQTRGRGCLDIHCLLEEPFPRLPRLVFHQEVASCRGTVLPIPSTIPRKSPSPRTHRCQALHLNTQHKPYSRVWGLHREFFCHNNPTQQLRMAAGCQEHQGVSNVSPSALLSSAIRARLTTEKPITDKSMGQSSSQRLGAEKPFLSVNGCGSCSNHKPLFLQKTMEHLCFPRPRHYRKT